MPAPIDPERIARFDAMLSKGYSVAAARREVGVSQDWAYNRAKGRKKRDQAKFYAAQKDDSLSNPKTPTNLSPEAAHALECFKCFRLRYTGRSSVPWQIDAAEKMVELLESPDKEYVVVNAPPSGGKSTLMTHDIPLWLICRNRAVRILIGSAIQRQATLYTNRLRRSLQMTTPHIANDDELARGMVDAVACVSADYGRFKPDSQNPDVWTAKEFSVAQHRNVSAADKEHTVQGFGKEGGVLGNRVDFCIWDDLIDERNLKTVESREELRRWWKSTAETRIDPRGVMVLQGQRMGADDLYRFALDMKTIVLDEDGIEDTEAIPPPKYKHIVYKAHYEDLCTGKHPRGMEPWPASCLLDPRNLPWKELASAKINGASTFLVQFQQEDADYDRALVNPAWIAGDGDSPGCWDKNRGLAEVPRGLVGDFVSIATADPSPTKFWAITWILYHPASEQRFLMDLERRAMDAPDFLDWDYNNGVFSGLMEEWQQRSMALGVPISAWVVEANAAQRFILQYDHARRWQIKHGVDVLAHQTSRNKTDPTYGVQTIAPHFKHGRVRLPGKQQDPGRLASMKLVDEVTKWPEGRTDDCVMSWWFFEYQLSQGNLYTPPSTVGVQAAHVPSWMKPRKPQPVSA